jgi:hypothetical protein
MSIKLNSVGGGSVTIQEPNTASDFTLSVPAQTANLLTNRTPGTVLQVVQATTNSSSNTTSNSFVSTGFSASITPSSSTNKILVILSGGDIDSQAGGRQNYCTIFRNNTTNIGNAGFGMFSVYHDTARSIVPASGCVLDSPATTSSTTYTLYFRSSAGRVDHNSQQAQVSFTLMEIAA